MTSALFFAIAAIFIRKGTATGKALDAVLATIWINVIIFLSLSILIYFPDFGLNLKSLLAFTLTGIIGTVIARFCFYAGIKRVGSSRTVPISRGNLLVASLIAIAFLGEFPTAGHLIGIFLLSGGIIVVSYEMEESGNSLGWKPSPDLLFPLGAMFFLGMTVIFGKIGLSEGVPPIVGLTIKFSTALAVLSSYYIFKGDSPLRPPFAVEEKKMYLLAGLFLSVSFGLYYGGLKIAKVIVVTPFQGMTPFFTLILSYFYLKKLERITPLLVLGSLTIVAGAIIIGVYM